MSQKREDLQGLRGWAIFLVLLFHFYPSYFPNGYVGVDMFFVLSGFLMAMILSKSKDLDIPAYKVFYYRRIKRILPLYYMVIILTLLTVLHWLPTTYRSLNLISSRKAIALMSNIREDDPNQAYEKLLQEAEDLFTHTWSLSVEVQWYLLVPFVFFVQRQLTSKEKPFFLGIVVASFYFYITVDKNTAFYNVLARLWQFCSGILAFIWQSSKSGSSMHNIFESGNHSRLEGEAKCHYKLIGIKDLVTWCFFLLVVAVPLLMISLPPRFLRVETTFATAVLIYLGRDHQISLLTKPAIVFTGDISYALYLFHWPVFVVTKHCYPDNPLGPFFGMFVSVCLAMVAYWHFETKYLAWPSFAVILLLVSLIFGCIFLSLQDEQVDELKVDKRPVDYTKINVKDAAWNMTLMRYLNTKEAVPYFNMLNEGCTYSERFVKKKSKPAGFCSMKNGSGEHSILVLGNSFACNQGGLVYNAFKSYAKQFNIFCLLGCEVTVAAPDRLCSVRVNYTSMIQELNPDIIFVIERALYAETPFNPTKPLAEDEIFKSQAKFLKFMEQIAKKIYIVQALPHCVYYCTDSALKRMKKGQGLSSIKDTLIKHDEFFARQRIWELGKRCEKCEIVDYLPVLVDEKGRFLGYDPKANLMYIDDSNHYNRFGKERIQTTFDRLAKEFTLSNKH